MTEDKNKTKTQLIEELVELRERNSELEKLSRTESTYRTTFEQSPVCMAWADLEGILLEVNDNFCGFLGYERDELVGIHARDITHPDDLKPTATQLANLDSPQHVFSMEKRYLRRDGGVVWAKVHGAIVCDDAGSPSYVELVIQDITTQKLAECQLEAQHARIASILEGTNVGAWEWNVQTGETIFNDRWAEIIGRSLDEMSPVSIETWKEYTHHGDLKKSGELLEQHFKGELEYYEFEARMKHKDGRWIWVLDRGKVFSWTDDGNPLWMYGTHQDVTERKQAEEKLRQSEEKYRSFVQNFRGIAFRGKMDFTPIFFHGAVEDITGYTEYEFIVGKPRWDQIVHSDDLSILTEDAKKLCSVPGYSCDREYRIRHKNGQIRWVSEVVQNICDEAGQPNAVQGAIYEITERKRSEKARLDLEAQVQQAQKLESLGVLAGGIAHDFNNLLMAVLGNADVALAQLSPVSPATDSIERIQQSATRAAELANQMLAYSGKGQFVITPVSLSEVVQGMGHMLNASIPKTTLLKYQLPEVPTVEADVPQIRQVIMNLVTNAVEALEDESGVVTVSTGVLECDDTCPNEGYVAGECTEGTYTYIEVTDTGVGMDEDTISKIFDPFFTTKFTGRGLGMAALFGIVNGHNGATRIESELGKGTTIRVLFPVTDKPAEALRPSVELETISTVGGTILLVDDEPAVLEVGTRMLEMSGYEVLTAKDGSEAVTVFKEHANEIACAILDLTMPKMNGEQTFVELQKINSKVPVLLSSGYSIGEVESRFSTTGFAGFLQKPYRLNELQKSVGNVLAK